MLTKEQLQDKISGGLRFLDGATGSNLQKAGMPKGCCTEQWVLENPGVLQDLQRNMPKPAARFYMPLLFRRSPLHWNG